MTTQVHDGEFVRVFVPAYLERSLQLALGTVHAPFFTERNGEAFAVVLQRQEWERVAPRFATAQVTVGFRLVTVVTPEMDSGFPARLRQVLTERGVSAALMPSFHNDYVLVRSDQLEACLQAIRQPSQEPDRL